MLAMNLNKHTTHLFWIVFHKLKTLKERGYGFLKRRISLSRKAMNEASV